VSELPDGWVSASISTLIDLNPKNDIADDALAGFMPMSFLGKDFLDIPKFEPRQWGEIKKSYTHFADGDVLLAKITPCFENGKAGIPSGLPNGVGAGSSEYFVCRTRSQVILPKYLLAYCKTPDFLQLGESQMTGSVGHKRVPKNYLLDKQIPLAPLNEQKRIADKLDRLLAKVDACRERCDRIPLILKRFRQSVLAAATSGELTEDWRESNDHSPRTSWQSLLIGDLVIGKPRNGYSPKAVEFETKTKSLTLTATTSGRFNPKHFKYINEIIPQDSHLWLEPEDILIQRANTLEYVGVSAIYNGPPKVFIYPDLMMKCKANSKVITKFLYYLLSSDNVRSYFRNNATGTAGNMPKINQQTVIAAPALVPPIGEQQEIVRRVEKLFAFADRLESRYQTARAKCDQLTPALLERAFQGELVPQDPNDEPVSVLLEKIQAEGNKTKRAAKVRKSKTPLD
jgi:type I restriction enzyme, S subunit